LHLHYLKSSIWRNFANLAIQNVFVLPSGSVACWFTSHRLLIYIASVRDLFGLRVYYLPRIWISNNGQHFIYIFLFITFSFFSPYFSTSYPAVVNKLWFFDF